MKIENRDKFFLEDDDGGLILVDKFDLDPDLIKMNYFVAEGNYFEVDYEKGEIKKSDQRVGVTLSFRIEQISFCVEPEGVKHEKSRQNF